MAFVPCSCPQQPQVLRIDPGGLGPDLPQRTGHRYTRNVTANPADRVREFSYKVTGGKFAALFDGTEKPLARNYQPIYSRTVAPIKP